MKLCSLRTAEGCRASIRRLFSPATAPVSSRAFGADRPSIWDAADLITGTSAPARSSAARAGRRAADDGVVALYHDTTQDLSASDRGEAQRDLSREPGQPFRARRRRCARRCVACSTTSHHDRRVRRSRHLARDPDGTDERAPGLGLRRLPRVAYATIAIRWWTSAWRRAPPIYRSLAAIDDPDAGGPKQVFAERRA